nr:MAG TPA: hypothetical protein [Caudoviricetes sp.]
MLILNDYGKNLSSYLTYNHNTITLLSFRINSEFFS